MWSERIWLTLETSSFCNLCCGHCSQHNFILKDKKFISRRDFCSVIDDIVGKRIRISNINPFFRGEPLMHPDFHFFMDYMEKKYKEFPFLDFISVHTNGVFLEGDNAESLLEISSQRVLPHPNNLVISIDAASCDTYYKIKGSDCFDKVIENISDFMRKRKSVNQTGPDIVFQFIVLKDNLKEAELFYNTVRSLADRYSHKPVSVHFSENNSPFRVNGDTIYYRLCESEKGKMAEMKELYKVCLIDLSKKGIIKNIT